MISLLVLPFKNSKWASCQEASYITPGKEGRRKSVVTSSFFAGYRAHVEVSGCQGRNLFCQPHSMNAFDANGHSCLKDRVHQGHDLSDGCAEKFHNEASFIG